MIRLKPTQTLADVLYTLINLKIVKINGDSVWLTAVNTQRLVCSINQFEKPYDLIAKINLELRFLHQECDLELAEKQRDLLELINLITKKTGETKNE